MFKAVSYLRPLIYITKQPAVNNVIERYAIGKNVCYQQVKYRTHNHSCNYVLTNIVVTNEDLRRVINSDTKLELKRTLSYLLTRDEFSIGYRKWINQSADEETQSYVENLLGAEKIISDL